ncbi:autotransporter outer membrane beta-barrel domain-containing protein [Sphingomonas alpina]|uniref:autotransporter outer membrane beta-barrel domain-containing protein n=1 Tax=Sphingomonas alpina TaxID=653931 RepID=UPI0021BAEE54|nr:autotransporter outer membrane beta-barrel domain-containing protein [Sphingomonas alpina]
MRHLLTTTCLTPILFVALPAVAQTTITTKVTTPVLTATAANGQPSDVTITSTGSVEPTGGNAVTLNSANNIKNEGKILISNASNANGIFVAAGGSGTITNSGSIVIDETYTPTDTDNDGDLDGPFAQGTNRFGIRTADGAGFTGSIVNTGTITVEGNDSGGIRLGGPLTGSVTSSGTITVTGDRAVGVRTDAVSGNVALSGTISVQGKDAIGVAADGDIGGRFSVQGNVTSTGYRTLTGDQTKLDADDLLQGGPAVRVSGNVGGGILFDAPPPDLVSSDPDEDKDGIPDAQEGTAKITSNGSAPAVLIGSATRDLTIGAVAGDTGSHSVVNKGTITGNGIYNGVDATGMSIGGQGHAVNLGNGISNSGTIQATGKANATALKIGAGTTMLETVNSGTIAATGGGDSAYQARAVSVEAGASMPTLRNSGTISATTAALGTATAIYDASGTLKLIENSGVIGATGSTDVNRNIAIDLRSVTSGATIKQLVAATGKTAPSITGVILLGSGNDLFDLADGSYGGNVDFGAGDNKFALSGDAAQAGAIRFGSGADTLSLAGTARTNGDAFFGTGTNTMSLADSSSHTGRIQFEDGADTLTLSGTSKIIGDVDLGFGADTLTLGAGTAIRGNLFRASGAAANISGLLDLANTGTVALSSLNVTATGMIGVNISTALGSSTTYDVSGNATFAAGSKVLVRLDSVTRAPGVYTIVRAGSITGGSNLVASDMLLPFLFTGNLTTDPSNTSIKLTIGRKSATQLGVTSGSAGALDAVFAVIDKDAKISSTILAIGDGETFRQRYSSFLPDYAGGVFESVTQASRATARFLQDPNPNIADMGQWGFWLQQVAWGTSKNLGKSSAYDVTGYGINGGLELDLGAAGRVGAGVAYLSGTDGDGSNDNEIQSSQYEAAIHWRVRWGGLAASARASAATINFDSVRRFDGVANNQEFNRTADGKWNGKLYSAAGALSYDVRVGKRLHLRPIAAIDYYRLTEQAHTETGGGDAFNLIVNKRKSDELAATGSVQLGYDFGSLDPEGTWMRLNLEGGRREIVGGSLGPTVARFSTGNSFTLTPEDRESGFIGRLGVSGGRGPFALTAEGSAEQQQGHAAIAFRLGLKIGM